ncbi:MAG: EAL domain-containing protein [Shewanella sp.]
MLKNIFLGLLFIFASLPSTLAWSFEHLQNSHLPFMLNAKKFSIAEGLSESAASSVAIDAEGHLWIGTFNGLNRYNGNTFSHYVASATSGLSTSFIRSLLNDSSNRLLVGTNHGLVIYDSKQDKFTAIPIVNFAVGHIHEDNGQIFISTTNKVFSLSQDLSKLVEVLHLTNDENILTFELVNQGIVLRTDNGNTYLSKNNIITPLGYSKQIESFNGKAILVRDNGLFDTNNKLISNTQDIDSLVVKNNIIYAISKKNILSSIDGVRFDELGILHNDIPIIAKPNLFATDDKLIIATVNQGFILIDKTANIINRVKVRADSVWDIASSNNNDHSIFIAYENGDIIHYDKFGQAVHTYVTGILGAKSIANETNYIYLSSLKGLFKLNKITSNIEKIADGQYTVISKSRLNGDLLVGDISGYITKVDGNDQFTTVLVSNGYPIFNIHLGNDSALISTQIGIYSLNQHTSSHIIKDSFAINAVTINQEIYFGTESGLKHYNGKNITYIHNNKKSIYSLAAIDEYVIAASVSEVIIYNTKNHNKTIINRYNGAQDEYNAQAISTVNNSILLGGNHGIDLVNPAKAENYFKSMPTPRVAFNDLLIFNKSQRVGSEFLASTINHTEELKLKYSDYPFTINFSAIGRSNNQFTFKYKLSELSDQWIEANNTHSATYTNLSPGKYVFSVYATDNQTQNIGPEKSIILVITPPWWLSTSAKLIYLVIGLLIIAIILRAFAKRAAIQKQIAQSEERLKLSLWGSGDEMWDWDIETGHIFRSNIWGTLEFPRDGRRSGTIGEDSNIHPQDQSRVSEALNQHFDGKTDHFEVAYRVKGKHDNWLWILDRAKIVERDQFDNALRMTGTIKNISIFKQAEEQLKLFERAIKNISEGMFILDAHYCFVEVNEACCNITGKNRQQLIGQPLSFDAYPKSYSAQIKALLRNDGRWSDEIESIRGDGNSILIEITIDAINDEQGELSHYVGVFSDISRRKYQEEELRKLTNNDVLTGLPNRANLQVSLHNLVKKDQHHTLMVLDLDKFKKINDSLGHQVGDQLLCLVASRLVLSLPSTASIYRLGGDEFAVLLDNHVDISSCANIASRLITAFIDPFIINQEPMVVSVSIGIVFYPEDEQDEQALLRKADIAMYHAKSAGGNRYQFYSESLNLHAIKQLKMENLIRKGLLHNYFEVYYQPKVDVKNHMLNGMEALVRLRDPEFGLIPPSEFIPLAEETGLIAEIGDLVLTKACFATQHWREQGLFNGRVAVNLSSHQFALADLQQRIESILQFTHLPPHHLEIEITEGTVIKQPEKAIKVMQELAEMGVHLALDDFGTGYSSLSYLKRFPIHTLKIDKAFIDDITNSERDMKMVDSIITIAHNMGLLVVAEGVENASQLAILKSLNCEEIQGYVFSKPLKESEFQQLLTDLQEEKQLQLVS